MADTCKYLELGFSRVPVWIDQGHLVMTSYMTTEDTGSYCVILCWCWFSNTQCSQSFWEYCKATIFKVIIFITDSFFMCMNVCMYVCVYVHHMHAVHMEARTESWNHLGWNYRQFLLSCGCWEANSSPHSSCQEYIVDWYFKSASHQTLPIRVCCC